MDQDCLICELFEIQRMITDLVERELDINAMIELNLLLNIVNSLILAIW